jgi:hypothetical protein
VAGRVGGARQGSNLSTVSFIGATPDSSTASTAIALVELNASAAANEDLANDRFAVVTSNSQDFSAPGADHHHPIPR